MTVMHTSEIAKSVPMKTQQAIDMYAWKKLCPSVKMDEWLQIEKDIVKYKYEIQEMMAEGIFGALEQKQTREEKELFTSMEALVKEAENALFRIVEKYGTKDNLKQFNDAYQLVIKAKKDLEEKRFG